MASVSSLAVAAARPVPLAQRRADSAATTNIRAGRLQFSSSGVGGGGGGRGGAIRAHPGSSRSKSRSTSGGGNSGGDTLVTPQGTYPTPWATDLATIFGWDDVLEAAGGADAVAANRLLPKKIALDGANIAWSLGASVRSRFKCRQFPLSAGVVRALEYEPWAAQARALTILPLSYFLSST